MVAWTKATRKSVRDALDDGHFDKITLKSDGTVEVRRGYFYRMGLTPEKVVAAALRLLPGAKLLDSGDHWAPWPHDSYMWARIDPNLG